MNIRNMRHSHSVLLLLMLLVAACGSNKNSITSTTKTANPTTDIEKVQVFISEGHDTDPLDGGRPVVLIASALGVPPEVFREAFSHVHPAAAGSEPDPVQVKENKAALLSALGPYGITNDYLDTVSNYYRFNGSAGETWPQTPATATAIITNGVVTGFIITSPGSGYTSAPVVTLYGSDVTATATLSFSKDLGANGSLSAIVLNP